MFVFKVLRTEFGFCLDGIMGKEKRMYVWKENGVRAQMLPVWHQITVLGRGFSLSE